MPLLSSPIDGTPMRPINRYGVELDVCSASGGIWLDKGELEKLMHFIREEVANEQLASADSWAMSVPVSPPDKGHRKESGLERIMDFFEF